MSQNRAQIQSKTQLEAQAQFDTYFQGWYFQKKNYNDRIN